MIRRRVPWLAIVAAIALSLLPQDVVAQPRAGAPYAGRTVVDVLRDLDRQGLRVVFSTRVVSPVLRVAAEPAGPTLRELLTQVLSPHGLVVRDGPRGTLVVARDPRPRRQGLAQAAPTGTIRGRAVDADTGDALPDVLVVGQAPDQRVVTDADGRFELAGVAPGRQVLFVSLVGYVLARPDVAVVPDAVAELTVPLAPGTGAYTEALTVRGTDTAARGAAPVEFRIRSAELQELRGVLADDPFRAVQAMPGVATGDDFRAEFSVRGSDFRQMGFAVDDVAAPWLVHGPRAVGDTGTVAMVNGDILDEIALTSGAQAQPFGNRTGAWVQSQVREGSRDAFRMSGALSGTGASTVLEGPIGRARRGAWLASVRKSYIDWLIKRLDTQEDTTFGFTDAQAKASFDVSPRHQLQLTLVGGRSTFDEQDDTPSVNGVRVGRSSTALAIGTWRATVGDRMVVTQRTAWAGLRYRNTSDFALELAKGVEWAWTYRVDGSYAAGPRVTVDAGVSTDREWMTFRRQQYTGAGGTTPVLRAWVTGQRDRWRHGGYWRVHIWPSATTAIAGGVRVDQARADGGAVASPWLLTRWAPAARWSLAAGVGVAHQYPDLAMRQPDRSPRPAGPERARNLDLSAQFAVTPSLSLQASLYDRQESGTLRLDEALPRLVNGVAVAPFASGLWVNALDVAARGLEVSARRVASSGLVGWVAYAYGTTKNIDRATGERYWGDFDQRHQLNVHASYRLGTRTNASARFRFGSNMPVLGYFAETPTALVLSPERNATRLPTYARLDLRLNRTYNYSKRRLTLFAEVLNALNRDNVGRTDGNVRTNGQVTGFVETLFPLLPSAGIRIEF